MKINKHVLIEIVCVSMAVICFTIGIILIKKDSNTNKTDNQNSGVEHIEELVEVDDVDEITVVDARIEKIDTIYSVFVKIKNNTHEKIEEQDLLLTIKDTDGNELLSTYVRGVSSIDIGEETEFQTMTEVDITNAATYIVSK